MDYNDLTSSFVPGILSVGLGNHPMTWPYVFFLRFVFFFSSAINMQLIYMCHWVYDITSMPHITIIEFVNVFFFPYACEVIMMILGQISPILT